MVRFLLIALLALPVSGCASSTDRGSVSSPPSRGSISAADVADGSYLQSWGSWSDPSLTGASAALVTPESAGKGDDETPSAPIWTIVLQTFTGEGHQQVAMAFASRLPSVDPRFGRVRVHSTPRGSKVMFEEYDGPDDKRARADLKWVKSFRHEGRSLFRLPMFTRVAIHQPGRKSPFELMTVRLKYPNIDPLYTLQVAVWGAFDGAMPFEEAVRRADAQTRALRATNVPAFVHNDYDKELSMVTVGLFDHRALDAASGLYSPEVEALMRRFPQHLVNGEPVMELVNPSTTAGGTRPQAPLLVLVPRR